MTGELADLFRNRGEGVVNLARAMRRAFPQSDLRLYAGEAGFVAPGQASRRARRSEAAAATGRRSTRSGLGWIAGIPVGLALLAAAFIAMAD